MPELPEVETIRRDLQTRVLNKSIVAVDPRLPKTIRGAADDFVKELVGNRFTKIDRNGKLLQFHLERGGKVVLWHLKMTGQLLYRHGVDSTAGGHPFPAFDTPLPNKFSHLILTFDDGGVLYFNDMRQFGYVELVDGDRHAQVLGKYGLEPLTPNFTFDNFEKALEGKSRAIKAILLDQTVFAGLGNIYADEVCFAAKILPTRTAKSLSTIEKRALFDACQAIIASAIEHRGTTFKDFRDSDGKKGGYAALLKVYGRAGEPCLVCGTTIEKTRVAGRGTHFCPHCQH